MLALFSAITNVHSAATESGQTGLLLALWRFPYAIYFL